MVVLHPSSLAEAADLVRSTPCLLPVGGCTKPGLASVEPSVTRMSLLGLEGMVEYEPDEYTFTARAGTRLRDIVAELSARGQYLPFDPMLVESGSTLGGAVASGLSGPGRFRYGGVRDFILGVRFIDGSGTVLRMGGRVVKNAAGFDLPKFFVGSLGRFGVLLELTFKVFPRPATARTLRFNISDWNAKLSLISRLARGRWELDAIDVAPDGGVLVRVVAPEEALQPLALDLQKEAPSEVLTEVDANQQWASLREFTWATSAAWIGKLALAPDEWRHWPEVAASVPCLRLHLCAAGNLGYVAVDNAAEIPAWAGALHQRGWVAMTLRGAAPLWLGNRSTTSLEVRIKQALDGRSRFPDLDSFR